MFTIIVLCLNVVVNEFARILDLGVLILAEVQSKIVWNEKKFSLQRVFSTDQI